MAIDSYTKLVSEIRAYLINDDLDDTRAKEFVSLAEARFDREIRTREMLVVGADSDLPTTGLIPLPTGYSELAQLSIVSGSSTYEIQYVPLHVARNIVASQTSGAPQYYTVEGTNIRVSPTPDTEDYDYRIDYYGVVTPKLSMGDASNWLLAKAPDVYLYGSLIESAPFFEDDARLPVWTQFYDRAKKSLLAVDRRSRYQPYSRTRSFSTAYYEGRRTYPGTR